MTLGDTHDKSNRNRLVQLHADRPAKPVAFRPWQRVWQCNDIRVTETAPQLGVIHYDLGGTIWGGSQFTWDFNRGIYFNGRPCLLLAGSGAWKAGAY